jgi:hypothetical protein
MRSGTTVVVSLEGAASSGNLGVSAFEQKIIMMESGTEK